MLKALVPVDGTGHSLAAIRHVVKRLEASGRLTRQTEAFHLEQDEIRHDLEALARVAEGERLEVRG